jgi:hypothetical protein
LFISNAVTTGAVTLSTSGGDANIGLNITTKGTGTITIDTGTGAGHIDLKPGSDSIRFYDDDSSHFYRLVTGNRTADYDITLPASSTTIPIISQVLTFSGPSAARTYTLPDSNQTLAGLAVAQTFTSTQTFRAANAIRSEAASTQDAIVIAGRAGGTSSHAITITPATLSSSTTLTLPNTTGTVITSGDTSTVTNTMLAGSIADSKLLTISTTGKVSNSATTATSANTASAIVARDGSGNFSAGTITASLTGTASGNIALSGGTMNNIASTTTSSSITFNTAQTFTGPYLRGSVQNLQRGYYTSQFTIWDEGNDGAGSGLDADLLDGLNSASENTASTIVARDASGNFSAGAITSTSLTTGTGTQTWQITDSSNSLLFRSGTTPTTRMTITDTGTVTATTFSGSGASLTNLPAGQLTGTVASARLTDGLLGQLETSFNIGRIWSRPFNTNTWTLRRDVTTPTAVTSNSATFTTFALGYTPTTGASGDVLRIELSLGSTAAPHQKIFVEVTCTTNSATTGQALLSADAYGGVSGNILQVFRYFAEYNISTSNLQVRYPTRIRLA